MDIEIFDREIDRRHSDSYKWTSHSDDPEGTIPLWVADMDFRAAEPIIEALRRRVEHGVFGYVSVPDEFYRATTDWFEARHGWTIARDSVIYTSGVVPAISAIIKGLTRPGDRVLVQTPVYNCFFSSIRNNKCEIADAPLKLVDRRYEIDFDALDKALADERVKVMLLCNPHNPAGRVWTRHELEKIDRLTRRHGVTVISDEIHCELTFSGHDYTPYATVSPEGEANSVSCISPSKAFNTAGLQIAEIVCTDARRRALIDRAINDNEVCDVNPFGVAGLIAAYRYGGEWLDAVVRYIYDNYLWLKQFVSERLPILKVVDLEGTYLAWVDCRRLGMPVSELVERGVRNGVRVASGDIYGDPDFIRINLATQRHRLAEGMKRLADVIG